MLCKIVNIKNANNPSFTAKCLVAVGIISNELYLISC